MADTSNPKPWELPRAERNKVRTDELRPGDQFNLATKGGTVISVRPLDDEELARDRAALFDPAVPTLVVTYQDMDDPEAVRTLRKSADHIWRGILRAE